MIILGTNSIKDTSYEVANSLRFDHGSTDYLNKSVGGNSTLNTKGTFSTWLKRATTADSKGGLFSGYADVNNRLYITTNSDTLFIFGKVGGTTKYNLKVERNLRDPSAWINIIVAVDTTQGTAADRVKAYINGVQQTIAITTSPDQDSVIPWSPTNSYNLLVGRLFATDLQQGLDGYQAETVFVDGLALDQTSFGEFDEDSPTIWKPKDVSGLTFGNNGFYLEYKQSGTSQNSSGLGADTSGNDNHFAVNNLTSVDQSTDTCTNNFATWNPLLGGNAQYANFSEGNLKLAGNDGSNAGTNLNSTIGASSGKYYMEIKALDIQGTGYPGVGVIMEDDVFVSLGQVGGNPNSVSYRAGGTILTNGSVTDTESSYTDNDIIGIALDLDNGAGYFSKNGSFQNSGDPTSGSSRTGSLYNFTPSSKVYFFAVTVYTTAAIISANFGSPSFSISSGNSDANGYGNFEYAVPSGYYSLNTKNLAEFG